MIRTLIADSVALMRTGLLVLLTREPDIKVVAELDRSEFVIPAACLVQPDVAVVDGSHGVPRWIRHDHGDCTRPFPACGSVIMSASHSPCDLREAIAARADGFVMKDSDPDKITDAIRRVAAGRKALDPDLAFSTLTSPVSPLTAREVDVLRLAAQGEPAAEIAGKLYLSVGTVHNSCPG